MMKKLVTIIAAALLTMGLAANAMASFNDGDLIRVVYNRGGSVEVATDLGSISSIQSGGSLSTSAFSLSQISGATSMGDLYVAYFSKVSATSGNNGTGWVGVDSAASAPVTGNRKFANFVNGTNSITSYYQSLGAGDQVVADQNNVNSYAGKLAFGTGTLNGYIPLGIEQNLLALASGGSVTTTLYAFANQGGTSGVTTGTPTVLTLSTNADGTTSATPTPIPPSFLLMGSGLLGMVGIRRKFNA